MGREEVLHSWKRKQEMCVKEAERHQISASKINVARWLRPLIIYSAVRLQTYTVGRCAGLSLDLDPGKFWGGTGGEQKWGAVEM